MKLRSTAFFLLAFLLAACNFSLAEDVTPPPNYVPPTAAPTLGPLFPAEAPSVERGAAIYAVKCLECHGPTGLGDGEKGKQLPVTVAALALPQVGRAATPSKWYTQVTRGNIDRYMPPFNSLNDQQRWDVVAYALALHTTPKEIKTGKELFEALGTYCPTEIFRDQERMAAVSDQELSQWVLEGTDGLPALGPKLTEGGVWEIVYYLRSLSFAASSPTPEPVTATPTLAATETIPAAAVTEFATPGAGMPSITETTTPLAEANLAKLTGTISGRNLANITVTLRGYDHAPDASGPQEIVTLTTVTEPTGTYAFENLEMIEGRIFVVEATYLGVTYTSEAVVVAAGVNELTVPPLTVYETTTDYSALAFDQVHIFTDIADQYVQIICVYTFSNTGEKAILVTATTDIPFLKIPGGAQNIGFDVTQDSAPLLSSPGGFAIPPSDRPYGFVAFYDLPYGGKAQVVQPFALAAKSILVLVPEGVKVKSEQLTEGDVQTFQGADYREYLGASIKSGETLTFDMSGKPKAAGAGGSNSSQGLVIGLSALGLVLILAGVWMYLRSRNAPEEEDLEVEEEDEEFEFEEEILDAILALDDLHRAGRLPAKAYQARRAELKARLQQ